MVQKLAEIKKFLAALATVIAVLVSTGILSSQTGALATTIVTTAVALVGAIAVYFVPNAAPVVNTALTEADNADNDVADTVADAELTPAVADDAVLLPNDDAADDATTPQFDY